MQAAKIIARALRGSVTALAVALVLAPVAASADTAPGGLNAKQIAELRSQPLPVLVPAYVPAGFRLVRVEATSGKQASNSANGYLLEYRSSDGRKFMVNVGDGDFGDVAPDYTSFRRPFVVNSTVIGSTTMSPSKIGTPDQPEWLYVSDYRPLERLGNSHAMLIFSGTKMSADDLRRIYSSLRAISR
ncbi:MAG: hypothetical protein WAK11_15015 [Candidatus Cybelea sp.]